MISQRLGGRRLNENENVARKEPESSRVAPTTARYFKGNPSGCVLMVAAG